MAEMFYIKDYITDKVTDSEAIEECFKTAKAVSGEKTIVFDGKDYSIDRAILIPSDTQIIIDGCTVKQKDEVFDNIFRGDNLEIDPENPYGAVLDAAPLKNIKITGKNGAKLIGTDKPKVGYHPISERYENMTGDFYGWRTLMISLSNCDNFEISGLSLRQTMCWAISFDSCENGYIHDINIHSNVKNGDGIDFRSGCHYCKVENITGYTSDDTVACTALCNGKSEYPVNNYLYPMEPYNSSGKITDRDIHHIEIRNIKTGGFHHGVICLAAWGNQVYDIDIDDFDEINEGFRESTVKIYTGYGREYNRGDLHDIRIKNINAKVSKYAVQIAAEAENVTTENIRQENPEGSMFYEEK